jgi:DNA-binding transcriptional LysR family regulator
MERAAAAAERAAYGQVAQLRIGTIATEGSRSHAPFVAILHRFARLHRDVRIVLISMSSAQLVQALLDEQVDIGFVDLPVDSELVGVEKVRREPLLLALPRHHPLALQQVIPWHALADEAVIVSSFAATTGSSALVTRHLRSLGLEITSGPEADGLYNALAFVIAGLGVTFVPGLPESLQKQNIVVREMQGPRLYLETGVAYKKDALSAQTRLFLDVVTKIRGRPRSRSQRHALP